MKQLILGLLLLGCAAPAGAQQLALDDLVQLMEKRRDTAFHRSLLAEQGFNHNGIVDKNQVAYMGDVSDTVRRFTEIVFMQSAGGEVQLLQYCTRHPEVYKGMLKQVKANRDFRGQPSLTEDGELSESFSSNYYNLLLESVNQKSKYVISIWIKGAKL